MSTLALAPPVKRGEAPVVTRSLTSGPYAIVGPHTGITRPVMPTDGRTIGKSYDALYAFAHYTKKIPAFARKYSLPCSACHTVWPELNWFGIRFRDNGYQLGNDRDAPVWQNPSYFPMAVRTTPNWHYESTTHQPVDAVRGDPTSGKVERTVTQQGFDLSGFDLLFLGTLHKNISFGFVSSVAGGSAGLEAAFVRFDDLMNSHWANLKFGKFELDNMLSEKRILTLSSNGSFYQSYHFVPVGDVTAFGLGNNQVGAEFSGHSTNSYTRYAAGIFSTTDGESGVGGGQGYDAAVSLSQAFDAGALGVERIGAFGYFGRRPTLFETVDGAPIPGSGTANKTFQRYGLVGDLFAGDLELIPLYLRGHDDAFLGTGTPGDQTLPAGARAAEWNVGLLEVHYYINQQNLLLHRSEMIRMSQQAVPGTPSDLGNVDAYTFGYRWYPMMTSRAGLALHSEFSMAKTIGAVPLSGLGVGQPPLSPATPVWSRSVMFGLDFAF